MYLADSRTTDSRGTDSSSAKAAVVPGTRPGRRRPAAVPGTVLALGAVSLITDISSEMVTAVLPLYVVAGLGLSPLGFGLLDGINNGVGALVRLAGGHLADGGGRRHKLVAGLGYGLSALCKPLLLLAHTLPAISAVLAADRTGKGLRTAPRDAMISLATEPEHRGRAFGVHRAMDTTGALLGPLAAFAVLHATVDGYDAVFLVSACAATLGVLVLTLFVPTDIPPPPTARPTSGGGAVGRVELCGPTGGEVSREVAVEPCRSTASEESGPASAEPSGSALGQPSREVGAERCRSTAPDGSRSASAESGSALGQPSREVGAERCRSTAPDGSRSASAEPSGSAQWASSWEEAAESSRSSQPAPADASRPAPPVPSQPARPEEVSPSAPAAPSRPTLRDSLGLLRQPELRRLALCAALLGLTTVSDSFLYLLLQRAGNLPAHLFPLLPLGTAAVFLLFAVPLGSLADRISRRRLFLAGHAVLLLGYGLVLSPWHGIPAVAAVLVLHGTFYAATDGVLAAATAGAVPARHQGAGQALVGTAQALARFACSLAFGAAWSLWGGRTALAVTATALTASAVVASFILRGAGEGPVSAVEGSGSADGVSGLVDEGSGAAVGVSGPVDEVSGFAEERPGSAGEGPVSAVEGSGSAGEVSGPVDEGLGAAVEKSRPADEAFGLAGEGPEPAVDSPGPADKGPEPAVDTPGPADDVPEPAVGLSGPAVELSGPAVEMSGPAGEAADPVDHRPDPVAHRPDPIAHRPDPVDHRPDPADQRPSPIGHMPDSADEVSA